MAYYTVKVRFSDGEVAYTQVHANDEYEALSNAVPTSYEIVGVEEAE